MGDSQIRTVLIDGLHIEDYIFNWNDRLLITHLDNSDRNIVNAHIVLPYPFKVQEKPSDLFTISDEENKIRGEVLEFITLFLASYHLVNRPIPCPIILQSGWMSHDRPNDKPLIEYAQSGFSNTQKSTVLPVSKEHAIHALNSTIPFFEKVMEICENKNNSLKVALLTYHRAGNSSSDDITNLIDMITILESLFTRNDGEVSFKLALRTAIFVEDDISKRKNVFELLRIAYKKRSDLVHGNDMTLDPKSVYHEYQMKIYPIIQTALVKYIQLLSEGKNKNKILESIDDNALGIK